MKLKNSIILTLAYSAQFGQALTLDSLWQRLIFVKTSKNALKLELKNLVNQNLIITDHHFWTLREFHHLFAHTHKRQTQTTRYWVEAKNLVGIVNKIPWITGVAVTGSIAVNNAKQKDDLDFMIVTDANRLWLSRLLVNLYSIAVKKRKPRNQPTKPGWCFNLWLSTSQLAIPATKHSLYTAFELIQSAWLTGSAQLLQDFWQTNSWVTQYLPQAKINTTQLITHPSSKPKSLPKTQTPLGKLSLLSLFNLAEQVAYLSQFLYMFNHRTSELVTRHQAFFHPLNTKRRIYYNWQKIILVWQRSQAQ